MSKQEMGFSLEQDKTEQTKEEKNKNKYDEYKSSSSEIGIELQKHLGTENENEALKEAVSKAIGLYNNFVTNVKEGEEPGIFGNKHVVRKVLERANIDTSNLEIEVDSDVSGRDSGIETFASDDTIVKIKHKGETIYNQSFHNFNWVV